MQDKKNKPQTAAAAAAAANGHVANGEPPPRPRTAAEYAGTVNGFVNLTMSFDSGIDVMGSTYF